MNIKKAIEKFRNEDIAINVHTEQEWAELMELLEEHSDIKWGYAVKPTLNNQWKQNGEDSCILIDSILNFSSKHYYKNRVLEIITFQDFKKLYQKENDIKQFTKSDLKDYMKVVHRNGEERIAKGGTLSNDYGYAVISQVLTNGLTWVYEGNTNKEFDIVEVHEPTLYDWNLLWKREEPKYMLLFPSGMFGTNSKLAKFPTYYDWLDISYEDSEKFKVEFTQEEIDAIPFNTDMFTKVEVE